MEMSKNAVSWLKRKTCSFDGDGDGDGEADILRKESFFKGILVRLGI